MAEALSRVVPDSNRRMVLSISHGHLPDVREDDLHGIGSGLHNVTDAGILATIVLHVLLEHKILQIEAHLRFLHLLRCFHQGIDRGTRSRPGDFRTQWIQRLPYR